VLRVADLNCLDFTTVVADSLENLLDLVHEAIVVDRSSKLDDTKVARAFLLVLFAGGASEVAIDSTEMRIVRTFLTRS
jgi:hypothetical protein